MDKRRSKPTQLKPSDRLPPQPSDYLYALKDETHMSEAQKIELLTILFQCMKGFCDLAHGLTPVQNLIENFENAAHERMILVKCEHD